MVQIKTGTQYLLPVRLLSTSNIPVTGVTYNQVTATAYYENGSSASISPSAGASWTELSSGAYLLKLTSGANTVVGALTVVVTVSGSQDFVGVYDVVGNLASDIYTLIGTPPGGFTTVFGVLGTPVHGSLAQDIAAGSGGSSVPPNPMIDVGIFKQSSSPRILVRLLSSSGAPVTGVAYTAVTVSAVDGAGTITSPAVTMASWVEITTGVFMNQGVYQLNTIVPTATEGTYILIVAATGAQDYIGTYVVSNALWDDIYTRIGPPVSSNISSDIANVYSRLGTPFGASVTADIGASASHTGSIGGDTAFIYTSVGSNLGTNVSTIESRLGTPPGGSYTTIVSLLGTPFASTTGLAGDIGASASHSGTIGGDTSAIYTRIGSPFGASIAADIGASASHSGTIGGDTAFIYTTVGTISTNVSTVETRLGTPPGGSYNTVFQVLGTPASPTTGLAGDIAAISGSISGNIPKNSSSNLTFAVSQSFNLIVQLLSSSGIPVPGIAYNTSGFFVYLVDGTGSISTVTTTSGNWVELGGVFAGSGTYQLKTQSIGNIGNALYQFVAPGAVNTNLLVNIVRYQPYDDYLAVAAILGVPVSTVSGDIASIQTKLGTPAAATVSADIANVQSTANLIYTSTGAGLATTVNAINTSVGSNLGVHVSSILTDIGTSPGGSYGTVFANLVALRKVTTNRWKIITTGPGANTMVFYDDDQVTPLFSFNLYDSSGVPTYLNPFERHP